MSTAAGGRARAVPLRLISAASCGSRRSGSILPCRITLVAADLPHGSRVDHCNERVRSDASPIGSWQARHHRYPLEAKTLHPG